MYNVLIYSFIFTVFFVLNFGMANAKLRAEVDMNRQLLGMCVLVSALNAILNFIGLFIMFCMTGFAEHGLSYKIKCNE